MAARLKGALGSSEFWSAQLLLLAASGFAVAFGEGIINSARANFFVDVIGLSGSQVLWLEGLREIPGILLIVIAAALMYLPATTRAAVAILVMGVGFMLEAATHSFWGLVAMAVVASTGTHVWMPLQSVLGFAVVPRRYSGRALGVLGAVASLASIVGMGAIGLVSALDSSISLRLYFVLGGAFIVLGAVLLLRLPRSLGATAERPPRVVLKARYWLYYVLTFFEGSRKQVLHTFGTLYLVDQFKLPVWQISALLVVSSVVNLAASPLLGALVDRLGERKTLSGSYVALVLCCGAFAVFEQPLLLMGLFVLMRMLVLLGMGLNTYVNRVAPRQELDPTLSAGISINHITSVGMPIVAGLMLPLVGYQGVFAGTALLILLSIPFTLAIRMPDGEAQMAAAPAE
ncbi:MAG: MFS transporter [Anaerolineae bacterium]|jgi:predicted MFS family arabinose efflux permease